MRTGTPQAGASPSGPRNLLANASFEDGTRGWKPLGKARLTRSTEATEGSWSLRILADPSAEGPVGITIPDVTLTKLDGRYHTNAFVRASAPGTILTIGRRQYHDGKPVPGSNTLGLCLLVAGAALLRAGAYRGRHRAGRTAAP